jgi:hypothetical protein
VARNFGALPSGPWPPPPPRSALGATQPRGRGGTRRRRRDSDTTEERERTRSSATGLPPLMTLRSCTGGKKNAGKSALRPCQRGPIRFTMHRALSPRHRLPGLVYGVVRRFTAALLAREEVALLDLNSRG